MPNGQDSPPTGLVLDGPSVQRELRGAASAIAMQLTTSSGWRPNETDVSNIALDIVGTVFNPIDAFQGRFVAHGSQVVTSDARRYAALRDETYRLFSRRFVEMAAKGPSDAIAYLQEKRQQRLFSQRALAETFESARQTNDLAIAELNRGIDACFAVRTIANTAGVVASAFVSLPVALVFGIGYSIAATVAESIGQARVADLVAFLQPPTVSAGVTAGQEYLSRPSQVVNDELVSAAERQAARAEERLARLRGGSTARAMGRTGRRMVQRAEQRAAQRAATATRVSSSSRMAGRMKIAGTGGAIIVGLFFMKDELATMGRWITTGESYTEQQRSRR